MHVIVVGAGVVGLSTAVRLRLAGHRVAVWAAEVPPYTTSDVAAALWYPYGVAAADDRTTGWAMESYHEFARLARDEPGAGVRVRHGRELCRAAADPPGWAGGVPGFRLLGPAERPAGYQAGWAFPAPVADTSVYLGWLLGWFRDRLGGSVETRRVSALRDLPADVVVNCSGLAARDLVQDPTVQPVRGQVVRVAQVGLAAWTLDQSHATELTYVVPRGADIVLGGTAEAADDPRPDPGVSRAIVERCAALEPVLAHARVLGNAVVGLRPWRAAGPRVEHDPEQPRLVHNYGHGGAGVTLAWGCAGAVAAIVADG